jgi:hypothetical protein
MQYNHLSSSGWYRLKAALLTHRSIENGWYSVHEQVVIRGHRERRDCRSMVLEWILTDEYTRTTDDSQATNLRKTDILISICSKVVSIILTEFEQVFISSTWLYNIFFNDRYWCFRSWWINEQCLFYSDKQKKEKEQPRLVHQLFLDFFDESIGLLEDVSNLVCFTDTSQRRLLYSKMLFFDKSNVRHRWDWN